MFDVKKFAKPIPCGPHKIIRFDCNTKEETAQQFRLFADAVERGNILIQKVQSAQVAGVDDYYMEALFIEYAQVEEGEEKPRKIERIIEITRE